MASKKRLIDANALISNLRTFKGLGAVVAETLVRFVKKQPAVDAVELVHSWWEKSAEGYKICHHCKADVAIFSGHKNYCPNCGAKMDGDRYETD